MKKTLLQITHFVQRYPNNIAWIMTLVTVVLAVVAWGQGNDWEFVGISLYRLFPLFGLVAFSLFWAQYIMAALSSYGQIEPSRLGRFFGVTSLLVLVALLFHPGLLSYQLWLDGYGLPPQSILQHAVVPGYEWIVLLGMTSWVVFMLFLVSYKFHHFFRTHKWWIWFGYIGEVAMIAVYYHGLRLGGQLQQGWFKVVWIVYGITLIIALVYLHRDKLRQSATMKRKDVIK